MKKGVFVVLFLLVVLSLLYYQPVNVAGQSPECFDSSLEGFVASSDFTTRVEENFVYEGVDTSWELSIGNEVEVVAKQASDGGIIDFPLTSVEADASIPNCNYYSFDYQRGGAELSYVLPLDSEQVVGSEKRCIYSIDSEKIASDLAKLGGRALRSLDDVCPELQNGRKLESGTECPTTADCVVSVGEGARETFGFTVAKDSCGNSFVEADNSGGPVSDIDSRAGEFVVACSGKDYVRGLLEVTPDLGGSGVGIIRIPPVQPSLGCESVGRGLLRITQIASLAGDAAIGCTNLFQDTGKLNFCLGEVFPGSFGGVLDVPWLPGRKLVSLGEITFSVKKHGTVIPLLAEGAAKQSTKFSRWADGEGNLVAESVSRIEEIEGGADGSNVAKGVNSILERKMNGVLSNSEINEINKAIENNYNKKFRSLITRVDGKTGKILISIWDENGRKVFDKTYQSKASREQLRESLLEKQDKVGKGAQPPGNGERDLYDDIIDFGDKGDWIELEVNGQKYRAKRSEWDGDNAVKQGFDENLGKFFDDIEKKLEELARCLSR